MPTDSLRPLTKFPAKFHAAVNILPETCFILEIGEKSLCRQTARNFRAFLRSMAIYPAHPTSLAAKGKSLRTRIQRDALLPGNFLLLVLAEQEVLLTDVVEAALGDF